jgi:ABC-2 type transport system permease protein
MADAATASSAPPAAIRRDVPAFNGHGVWAIYRFQMARFFRTVGESLATPVITTALYFVVFGAAIGNRFMPGGGIGGAGGISYGEFIVPGLIMMSIFTNSIFNASFGIYFPKFTGTIYEILSAPVSYLEIVIAYVGAAATKSVILGLVILATAFVFFPGMKIAHPIWMLGFLILVCFAFSLFGFIIGIWAQSFEQLNFIPMLVVTPLTFLGGAFYTVDMLPEAWRPVALSNPVLHLISGFRWTFNEMQDVDIWVSVGVTFAFLLVCLGIVGWMFKTGYRLKN